MDETGSSSFWMETLLDRWRSIGGDLVHQMSVKHKHFVNKQVQPITVLVTNAQYSLRHQFASVTNRL
jgi:hypothetical protein